MGVAKAKEIQSLNEKEMDIAIIGMACKFPGAENYNEYWQNLINGKNSIIEIPEDRWDWHNYYGDPQREENKSNSKWGGFIKDVDKFDARFFNLSPKEANYIDPQHRLFIEAAWQVIEDAGYSSKSLAGKKIGVYAGVSKNDYAELMGNNISAFVSTGTVHSILSNRVSYFFDFHGPSESVDTACSSALVALHNAIRDIQLGDCESAIVGGVNAILSPRMYISHGKSGMLSSSGQCKTYDKSADGYVRGEGVGTLFIKPLDKAIEENDNIIGIIKATAINHGGKGNFLTAPNVDAQADVVYKAIKSAGVNPRNISYIEAHGTGTPLGDPIEINGLKKAYRTLFEEKNEEISKSYCGLASVKTNIGHLESAAGIAGIIKVLLAMKYSKLPPLLNFKELNPYIELDNTPFYIIKDSMEWKRQDIDGSLMPRQAGVSSFGMGGVNAHVILEEAPVYKEEHTENQLQRKLILISSKKDRLKDTVINLRDYLKQNEKELNIDDVAFTLMFGRDEFEERLAIICENTLEVIDLLQNYIEDKITERIYVGTVTSKSDDDPVKVKASKNLEPFAQQWVNGTAIEWDMSSFLGKRIPLSGYAFKRQSYWFDNSKKNIQNKHEAVNNKVQQSFEHDKSNEKSSKINAHKVSNIHKIVISNNLQMLKDHRVQNKKTLPGVGYIDLVCENILSKTEKKDTDYYVFKNIYWIKPLIFSDESKNINISVKTKDNASRFQINQMSETYCQGSYELQKNTVDKIKINVNEVIKRCTLKETKDNIYKSFSKYGLEYGATFQKIDTIHFSKNEAVAFVNENVENTRAGTLDGAFQTAVVLSMKNNSSKNNQYVPYFLESFTCEQCLDNIHYYYVKQHDNKQDTSLVFDIYCCDKNGTVLASFKKFIKRTLNNNASEEEQIYYYTTEWRERKCIEDNYHTQGIITINADEALEKIISSIESDDLQYKIKQGNEFKQITPNSFIIDTNSFDDYLNIFKEIKNNQKVISHIIVKAKKLGNKDLYLLLLLIKSIIKSKFKNYIKIIYYCDSCSAEQMPYVYAVAGLARTLGFEYPRLNMQVLSMDKSIDDYSEKFLQELNSQYTPLHEIQYSLGNRLFREIVDITPANTKQDGYKLTDEGVYIICGGTGGLGRVFSRFLAKNYKAKLVFLGRRKADDKIQEFIDEIYSLQGLAEYFSVDIGDEEALSKVMKDIRAKHGQINGVIQAGGLIDDSFIINKKVESFERVLHPKIQGTINLDKATAEDKLDFFIMFSSVAALIPNQGQCDYATGNSFMDFYAEYRNKLVDNNERTGISLAINWPLWESGGIQIKKEEKEHLFKVFGMKPLSSEKGLVLFDKALNTSKKQGISKILGIEGDKEKINKHFNINKDRHIDMDSRIEEMVVRDLKNIISMAFRKDTKEIKLNTPLREYGVDSLSLITTINILNEYFDLDVKPTLLFEYETLNQIKDYLLKYQLKEVKAIYKKLGNIAITYRSNSLIDIGKSNIKQKLFVKRIDNMEFYMIDHVVEDKFNVPGAIYVEMARQAGAMSKPDRRVVRLTNNYWAKQLSSSGEPFDVYIQLKDKEEVTDYEIYSLDNTEQRIIHATGSIVYNQPFEPMKIIDIESIAKRCTTSWTREQIYQQIHSEGLIVGPSLMNMEEIYFNQNEALAVLELPQIVDDTYEEYLLHPTTLSGVFQVALINNRFYGDDNKEFIPISIENLEIIDNVPRRCYVYCRIDDKTKNNSKLKKFNLVVCTDKGRVVIKLDGFAIKVRNFNNQDESSEKAVIDVVQNVITKKKVSQSNIRALAQEYMKTLLAPAIGIEVEELQIDEKFETYGINSVLIMELNQELEKEFGAGLSKTLFFEYNNLYELTEYFIEEYKEHLKAKLDIKEDNTEVEISNVEVQQTKIESSKVIESKQQIDEDIAVIGVSGRYPKAKNINEFWQNLRKGLDCIEEIRKDRLDYSKLYNPQKGKGKLYSKWGSFIDDVDKFDALFFNISPIEAEQMDPQERLFLEVVWHTLEDAGYTRDSLSKACVGVFVGALWQPYQELSVNARNNGHNVSPSGLLYNIANRVSYYCNFSGPSLAIDTACSSSLSALHIACKSIITGESDLAIAGGVNLSIGEGKYLFLSENNFLSSDGKCRSFGKGGDGYVPGEGVGAVLLKPLSKAKKDGDNIYAVIKATAINHDGKTNGYTVPNPIAQKSMIEKALEKADINPRTISYIEAHGTGTSLGDPIEITGLKKAFAKYTKDKQFCKIGSAKSNIGHLEASAGIAGLTKILLQLRHKKIVPSLHSSELNTNIDFSNTPFIVQQQLEDWERPIIELEGLKKEFPRIAAISSFGAGGANAHAIIEEYEEENDIVKDVQHKDSVIILLSAKSEECLELQVQQLLDAIKNKELEDKDLVNMAYTLQVGREAMEERLAIIALSIKDLESSLKEFLDGKKDVSNILRGKIEQTTLDFFGKDEDFKVVLDLWIDRGKYFKIMSLWVKGVNVDWNVLYKDKKVKRISMPTYPFVKECYWLPTDKTEYIESSIKGVNKACDWIHPLIHKNTSDFYEQKFTSTFTGTEFFLEDHVVMGEKILPGVVYLEMAREAVCNAVGKYYEKQNQIILKNIVWIQPTIVGENPVELNISLNLQDNQEVTYEVYNNCVDINNEPKVYCQGSVVLDVETHKSRIDLEQLKNQCNYGDFSSSQCYNVFCSMEAQYGKRLQGIQKVYVGEGKVLARLALPEEVQSTKKLFELHPSLMDSALQICLIIGAGNIMAFNSNEARKPYLPFTMESLEINSKLPSSLWAYVRYSDKLGHNHQIQKLDIDLCDDTGYCCVSIKNFSSRLLDGEYKKKNEEASQQKLNEGTMMLSPKWEKVDISYDKNPNIFKENVVIIGGTRQSKDNIKALYDNAYDLDLKAHHSIDDIVEKLEQYGTIHHIMWIANNHKLYTLEEDTIINEQKSGAVLVFRMIKAMIRLNYGSKKLNWSVITENTQQISKKDIVNPTHASIHGLIGTMSNEYVNWNVRLIDMEEYGQIPIGDICVLRDQQGNTWAYRGQQWYRQQLVPVKASSKNTLYKQNGVYVVIGGAGGIGEVWTKYMIEKYQAQIVWIGRREIDETIMDKIEKFSVLGQKPYYISADATDKSQLAKACEVITKRYGNINGVIHSAIVLQDRSLANMDEKSFEAVLSTKVDISVRLAQVFNDQALDFVLFFSSINSFLKTAGQSNYVSGCTFKDAFARGLSTEWDCRIRTINWGYWGNVGIVASENYNNKMAKIGLGSIQSVEAMEALELLLVGSIEQIALLKIADANAIKELNLNINQKEVVSEYSEDIHSIISNLKNNIKTIVKPFDVINSDDYNPKIVENQVFNNLQATLIESAATILDVSMEDIDFEGELADFGFDAVILSRFTDEINELFELSLTPTMVLEYGTLSKIAEYLIEEYKYGYNNFRVERGEQ